MYKFFVTVIRPAAGESMYKHALIWVEEIKTLFAIRQEKETYPNKLDTRVA
jgi:hypothetical protein